MKTVQTPSPSLSPEKRQKANLFENENPEVLEEMIQQSKNKDEHKVMLRIDNRTHVLVSPKNATIEYAERLRRKYSGHTHKYRIGGRR